MSVGTRFGTARIPFRLFFVPSGFAFGSLQGPFRVAFGNYGVRFGSEKNPFSDLFRKWFQPRLPGGYTPFGGEPENQFFDIFKGNPFSNWRPQGAQRLPARRGLKTIDFRRDVSKFDDFTYHFS